MTTVASTPSDTNDNLLWQSPRMQSLMVRLQVVAFSAIANGMREDEVLQAIEWLRDGIEAWPIVKDKLPAEYMVECSLRNAPAGFIFNEFQSGASL
jgi:hypothetical protein